VFLNLPVCSVSSISNTGIVNWQLTMVINSLLVDDPIILLPSFYLLQWCQLSFFNHFTGQNRATAARVKRNNIWQTKKCVTAAAVQLTYRQCHNLLIPTPWPTLTMVYNFYILQTKLLLIDWHYTAHRSIRSNQISSNKFDYIIIYQ